MRRLYGIGLVIVLLCLAVQGKACSVYNHSTEAKVSADSIVHQVHTMASLYESITGEYFAKLYIKGMLDIQKKNIFFRYIPSMFRYEKGVNEYMLETSSELHFTAPNIYDQKVLSATGTVRGDRGIPGLLEYFNINIYSASLVGDRLLSPLAKNGFKYYTYRLDTVYQAENDTRYQVTFLPKTKSDQLVKGYMIVSGDVWSIREMRLSGRSELISFSCRLTMGEVGRKNEFLPVRYDIDAWFNFVGNRVNGTYTALLDYQSIRLMEKDIRRKRNKKRYNLSDSFSLRCDTNAYSTDASEFAKVRPIPLNLHEEKIYYNFRQRRKEQNDTVFRPVKSKRQEFWGSVGDFMVKDYKWKLANAGSIRFSPFINPLLFSYSGGNGLSYRQDFNYNSLFKHDRLLQMRLRLGYNFTRKEFYWGLSGEYTYWPKKIGTFRFNIGNGNRIYSSDVLDELKAMPDSIFNFDLIHLEYFKDMFFNFEHAIEPVNGLNIIVGIYAHKRTATEKSQFEFIGPPVDLPPDFMNRYSGRYISFAPRLRLEWTPGMYYYMNGNRKVNLRSRYPTFIIDYERGIKNIFRSTGEYERIEFDLQHRIQLGLMRSIYYRFGGGMFTNQQEMYFVDFANFSRSNLPTGWNDDIGGVFQLLDSRWYNSSSNYLRANFTYEAPFLFLRHLIKYTRYVQNERLYINALTVPHLNPYLEIGYGIGTHVFDFGVFMGSENFKFSEIGCKFTFELFTR